MPRTLSSPERSEYPVGPLKEFIAPFPTTAIVFDVFRGRTFPMFLSRTVDPAPMVPIKLSEEGLSGKNWVKLSKMGASCSTLQDTDLAGYLSHAHEQNLISTIEEGRRETQEEFYRVLEDRGRRDWEARKKRVFEQLGARVGGENRAVADLKKSTHGKNLLSVSVGPAPTLQMQSKMMAYDRVVADLNASRLRGTLYPIVHALVQASQFTNSDPRSQQTTQNFHVLAKITGEPASLPPLSHTGAHILNAPLIERKYARAYLGDRESREAVELRRQIAKGARQALQEQYWDVIERTIQARATEARLGGDPSVANKIRAYILLRHYRNGEWEDRIELVASQPLCARLFYLIGTGHAQEALEEATRLQQAIEHRESSFLSHLRAWVESADRRLPKPHRDQLHTAYNAHMLHSATADQFKLALYKLLGKIDPARRSVAQVTVTTEDWLWFQLSMVDEDEFGGLRGLAEVLLSYGERHMMACLARRASSVAFGQVSFSCAASSKELSRRCGTTTKPRWRPSILRLHSRITSGTIEQNALLLKLDDTREYNKHILNCNVKSSEEADHIPEAIKLYNLAGDYTTVISVLAQALGNTLAQPSVDEKARTCTNRPVGRERDAVISMLRVRKAMDAKDAGHVESALELMESTDLIPMDCDVAKITKHAEEFCELPDALQHNLQKFLALTMDIPAP
ncbi:NIC-domain-containing protein [Trametes versicolor FP-101664 SS1]|uniref:NIC-domain-containing protein n=1 Tax=Trametes versicolor (strain FP-101664) TaxID=717944 RepID=UPI0004623FA6|nr:NIC-domain-containing protein [Trametes versicolor FP-101664 SS1]EIW53679.1 NIC-domain-containing protein [Trametes versicolor FP-101664 SS1]